MKTRLGLAILASLLVHWVSSVGLYLLPSENYKIPDTIELGLVEVPPESAQQIVRASDVPENQKQDPDDNSKARFLSESTQRVLVETRARQTGKTMNRPTSIAPKSFLNEQIQKDLSGYEPVPSIVKPHENDFAASTTGESLPSDIAVGSLTALNSEKFQYYSFFSRIEDLVRIRWEDNVRIATERAVTSINKDRWTSKIEFRLKKDGHYHSARILQKSGMPQFDAASIIAFRDAGYFPNPPAELVEEDGFIHLVYSFTVHWKPHYLVRETH